MLHKNIWDFWAGRYEKLWVQKHSLAPTRRLVLGEIKKLLDGGAGGKKITLLDVGCGTGQLAEEIINRFKRRKISVTGVDLSAKMIELARKKNLAGVEFLRGDALELPFSQSRFDLIACCHSFPYYRDQRRALQEFVRVLKPGGHLLLAHASENSYYDRLVMRLVKLTTGRAAYPSAAKAAVLLEGAGIRVLEQKRLHTRFYIPSIILSIGKKELPK